MQAPKKQINFHVKISKVMHAVEGQELQAKEQADNLKKAAYAAKVFSGRSWPLSVKFKLALIHSRVDIFYPFE